MSKNNYNFSADENKSQYHQKVVAFFRDNFPLFNINQEYAISIDGQTLFCDLACKSPIKFIIEINPGHHYKYNKFFHKTKENFKEAQKRDDLKERWAGMNGYTYIILREEDFKKDAYKETLLAIFG